jgi:hypothetical protein
MQRFPQKICVHTFFFVNHMFSLVGCIGCSVAVGVWRVMLVWQQQQEWWRSSQAEVSVFSVMAGLQSCSTNALPSTDSVFWFMIFPAVTVAESGAQALEVLQRSLPGTFQLILTVSRT